MSRRDDIEQLITMHQRRLQKLKDLSSASNPAVPAEILIEIEDLEQQLQQLQTELAQASGQHQAEIQKKISGCERRLQKLQTYPGMSGQGGLSQEIKELEADIQQLQTDLEKANQGAHREALHGVLTAKQRRLHTLIQKQSVQQQPSYDQEIVAIEAELQQLQQELEKLA